MLPDREGFRRMLRLSGAKSKFEIWSESCAYGVTISHESSDDAMKRGRIRLGSG